jgi:hypothetical protein
VAFYVAVVHQLLGIFTLAIVASLAWNVLRNVQSTATKSSRAPLA